MPYVMMQSLRLRLLRLWKSFHRLQRDLSMLVAVSYVTHLDKRLYVQVGFFLPWINISSGIYDCSHGYTGDTHRFVFIIEGQADVTTATPETPPASTTQNRPSIRNALIMLPQMSLHFMRQRLSRLPILRLGRATHNGTLASRGDMLDCNDVLERNCSVVALSRCVTVEIKDGALMSWARGRLEETEKDSTIE